MPRETGNHPGASGHVPPVNGRPARAVHRTYVRIIMLISLRSAMLIIAALSASSVAPAQVAPGAEPIVTAACTSSDDRRPLVPDELDPQTGRSQRRPIVRAGRAGRSEHAGRRAEPVEADAAISPRWSPQLRSSDPGSRELECLAGRHLFRIEERAAGRPAGGRRSDRQSRQFGPLPVILLRRAVPAQPVLLHPRPVAAAGAARRAGNGRPRSRSPRSSTRICNDLGAGKALFFHAKRVSPRWRLKRVASIGNHVFYR